MESLASKVAFIESFLGKGQISANSVHLDVRCPFCNPRDKTKRKLSIRIESEANHCWTCDWKARSLLPLIKKFGTQQHLERYCSSFSDGKKKHLAREIVDDPGKVILPTGFMLLATASDREPDARSIKGYLSSRNVSEHDLWRYRIGYSRDPRWRRRVIVPSFDADGELNYFAARAIDPGRYPKYDNPSVDRLTVIFNDIDIDWSQRLTICEGPFDLLKCGDNATCLLGSSMNEQSTLFEKVIMNKTPVALALDGDMFSKRTPAIAKKLQEYDVNVSVIDVRDHGDPGSMTKEEFSHRLNSTESLDWASMFKMKLGRLN